MALDLETFKTAFRDFFTEVKSLPTTFDDAGTKWAGLYAAYAEPAQAGITQPVPASIDTAKRKLGEALAAAFRSATSAADLAPNMAVAFSAFWLTVVFQAGTAIGAVSKPNLQGLQDSLTGFFSAFDPKANPPAAAEDRADLMASLLHRWTRTVMVVNTPAGAPPLPPVQLT